MTPFSGKLDEPLKDRLSIYCHTQTHAHKTNFGGSKHPKIIGEKEELVCLCRYLWILFIFPPQIL